MSLFDDDSSSNDEDDSHFMTPKKSRDRSPVLNPKKLHDRLASFTSTLETPESLLNWAKEKARDSNINAEGVAGFLTLEPKRAYKPTGSSFGRSQRQRPSLPQRSPYSLNQRSPIPALEGEVKSNGEKSSSIDGSLANATTANTNNTTKYNNIKGYDPASKLRSEVATLQSEVATLQSEVATLQSEVATLQSEASTLQSEASTQQSEATSLRLQVEMLTKEVQQSRKEREEEKTKRETAEANFLELEKGIEKIVLVGCRQADSADSGDDVASPSVLLFELQNAVALLTDRLYLSEEEARKAGDGERKERSRRIETEKVIDVLRNKLKISQRQRKLLKDCVKGGKGNLAALAAAKEDTQSTTAKTPTSTQTQTQTPTQMLTPTLTFTPTQKAQRTRATIFTISFSCSHRLGLQFKRGSQYSSDSGGKLNEAFIETSRPVERKIDFAIVGGPSHTVVVSSYDPPQTSIEVHAISSINSESVPKIIPGKTILIGFDDVDIEVGDWDLRAVERGIRGRMTGREEGDSVSLKFKNVND